MGAENNTKRMVYNTIASLCNFSANTLSAFIINPLLLTYLGSNYFGVWKFCQRLMSYASVGGGRPGQALKWTIANIDGEHDDEKKKRNVGSAVYVWIVFLPVLMAATAIVSWFSPDLINGVSEDQVNVIRISCFVLSVNIILTPLLSIPEAVLIGSNRSYLCLPVNIFIILVLAVSLVYCSYVGWGIFGMAIVTTSINITRYLLLCIITKRNIKWFGYQKPARVEKEKFINLSILMLVWSLVSKLMITGDIIIIGYVVSANIVSIYIFSNYMIAISITVTALIVNSSTPGVGKIYGSNDFARAAKIRDEIKAGTFLLMTVLGSSILLWNETFVKLWVDEKLFVGLSENLLMVLLMVQLVFIRNDAFMIDLTLDIKKKVILGALSIVLSISLALWLTSLYERDITFVLIGIIAGRSIIMLSYPVIVANKFRIKTNNELFSYCRPLLFMAIIFISTYKISYYVNVGNWTLLIVNSILTISVLTLISYYLLLNKYYRMLVVNRLSIIKGNFLNN